MWDPLYDQVTLWAGLAALVLLCLPLAGLQRIVLTVYAWALRLALVALLAGGAYLWFHPAQLPVEVTDSLGRFPLLADILPEPGARHFGICAVSLIVAVFLPLLALLDVGPQAGRLAIASFAGAGRGPARSFGRGVPGAALAASPGGPGDRRGDPCGRWRCPPHLIDLWA